MLSSEGGGGGALKKFRQGFSCYFLGLKFDNLFFWVAQNDGYFLGVEKISITFFWLTGNLHYFFGLLKKKLQNYFLEIDFYLLVCFVF